MSGRDAFVKRPHRAPIAGAGGKDSGGSSARAPVEAADSLRSKQFARVVDLVSEGEIVGLVNGLKSVYLDDTPLQNADGSLNFSGVVVETRSGTQAQTYIPGFAAVENEVVVATAVTAAASVSRTVTNANINALRVTVEIPALTFQDTTNGDLTGTSVQIAVDVSANGGPFIPQPLSFGWAAGGTTMISSTQVRATANCIALRANIEADWPFTTYDILLNHVWDPATFNLEYKRVADATWIALPPVVIASPPLDENGNVAASTTTVSTPVLADDVYEMRIASITGAVGVVASLSNAQRKTALPYDTISGKTSSRYQRSYRIALSGAAPWTVRMRRITADSAATNLANRTTFSSFTEIIDAKLRYPNSAVHAVQADASQFRTIPQRGYEIKGLIIRVPSNYNPATRVYTGAWDGTFKLAWTNNPAWVYYDLVTEARYGLGNYIDAASVDKWTLYTCGQYCDVMVPDGFGGTEPRFTCNLYLQEQGEAAAVISNLASIFRAMAYWNASSITVAQDAPQDAIALFTRANVKGKFTYQSSARRARHTVALVSWNDPADAYRQKPEYVEDEDGIARYGVQSTGIVAFGCTSRGQAHRAGKWLLYSERMETETVTFRAGLDGLPVYPGAIIKTQDPTRAGKRLGGRVLASTSGSVTIDSAIAIETGKTYTLSMVLPDGSIMTRTLNNAVNGAVTVLTFATALATQPQLHAVWVVAVSDLTPEQWRVVAITEVDDGEQLAAEIVALEYRPDKYAAVEANLVLEPLQTSTVNPTPSVANLIVTDGLYLVGGNAIGVKALLSWEGQNALGYEVRYRPALDNWLGPFTTTTPAFEILGLNEGSYEFQVVGLNALGRRSLPISTTYAVLGKTRLPGDVPWFSIAGDQLSWGIVEDLDLAGYVVRFHQGNNLDWDSGAPLHDGVLTATPWTMTATPVGPTTLLIKAIDTSGNLSQNPAYIITDLGDAAVANIIESIDFEALGWEGTLTGGSIVATDLKATGISGAFYSGNPAAPFYTGVPTAPFYAGSTYPVMTYETPTFGVTGWPSNSTLTLESTITGSSTLIEYRKRVGGAFYTGVPTAPFYTGVPTSPFYTVAPDYQTWPGSVLIEPAAYQFRVTTGAGVTQGVIDHFKAVIDVPDIPIHLENVVISPGGTRLVLGVAVRAIKTIQLTVQSDGGGATNARWVDKDATLGPLVEAIDVAALSVAAVVDVDIQAY